ncbi:MAG: hypothetical protein BGO67_04700 [Alphaproteobacteria bacterium 41-28]|nr:MAG: hypothetical protein BGO67_04700 [Alphaproteobacteria bacterium 41-28]
MASSLPYMSWILKSFLIFYNCSTYTAQEKKKLRKERSKPLLKKLHKWLLYHQSRASPKSRLGSAIQYALNQWEALNTFLVDGSSRS